MYGHSHSSNRQYDPRYQQAEDYTSASRTTMYDNSHSSNRQYDPRYPHAEDYTSASRTTMYGNSQSSPSAYRSYDSRYPQAEGYTSTSRTARRRPSQNNITYPVPLMPSDTEGAMQLLPALMPDGRTAPINPSVLPPSYRGRAFEPKIFVQLQPGHFVVARRWSNSRQCHDKWAEGQVANVEMDSHQVAIFTVDHVDQYTYKKVTAKYSIRKGDQVEFYQGDTKPLIERHQPRADATAPTMGPAHARPSRALVTPTIHGEVQYRS